MFDICFYSGLPYTCNLCPEDSAPCFYMSEIRKQSRIMFINLKRVWVCSDNELFTLPRIPDYGKKLIRTNYVFF